MKVAVRYHLTPENGRVDCKKCRVGINGAGYGGSLAKAANMARIIVPQKAMVETSFIAGYKKDIGCANVATNNSNNNIDEQESREGR